NLECIPASEHGALHMRRLQPEEIRRRLRKGWESRPFRTITCKNCNVSIRTRCAKIRRFCSNKCNAEWKRINERVSRCCEFCGYPFTHAPYDHPRFCSRSCANRGGRWKRSSL